MSDFLIAFHTPANIGFAIEPLELTFFDVIEKLLDGRGRIHLSYSGYEYGKPRWLSDDSVPLLTVKYQDMSDAESDFLENYIRENDIQYVFAFDLPVKISVCGIFRRAGVKKIFSYCGAPMSSPNRGLKLLAKRIEVALVKNKPSHFIFESYGMQATATHGRGVPKKNTTVIRLGVDTAKYGTAKDSMYVYDEFSIPRNRKIFFYSGHMDERKGVHVIIKAALELVENRGVEDAHFLICGDLKGESASFLSLYSGKKAAKFITFAGYRDDIPLMMAGCYAGIIASTGWDSFPRSSLEMGAAGLPLLVSDMVGLNETVDHCQTGLLFPTGDHVALADKIEYLITHPFKRDEYSRNAVKKVANKFTIEVHKKNLTRLLKDHTGL